MRTARAFFKTCVMEILLAVKECQVSDAMPEAHAMRGQFSAVTIQNLGMSYGHVRASKRWPPCLIRSKMNAPIGSGYAYSPSGQMKRSSVISTRVSFSAKVRDICK